jgi:hypothetical protein
MTDPPASVHDLQVTFDLTEKGVPPPATPLPAATQPTSAPAK